MISYLESESYVRHSNRKILDLRFESAFFSCSFAKEVLDTEQPDRIINYTQKLKERQIPEFVSAYVVIIVEVKDGQSAYQAC